MLSPGQHRVLSASMALLMLFLGVALFTPLHKHQRGQTTRCSFDGLENAFTQAAEECVELQFSLALVEIRAEILVKGAQDRPAVLASTRAPPFALS